MPGCEGEGLHQKRVRGRKRPRNNIGGDEIDNPADDKVQRQYLDDDIIESGTAHADDIPLVLLQEGRDIRLMIEDLPPEAFTGRRGGIRESRQVKGGGEVKDESGKQRNPDSPFCDKGTTTD